MKALVRTLYFWVMMGIAVGVLIGLLNPSVGIEMKVLGDFFIGLVKMLIAPLIFCSLVRGISGASDMKKVGRTSLKALLYFEVVSTAALAIGLVVANGFKPGATFHVDPKTLDSSAVKEYVISAHETSFLDFIFHLIPKNFFGPLADGSGNLIQVILIAALFGFALHGIGENQKVRFNQFFDSMIQILFRLVSMIMYLAPLGAMGAIAFTVGKYGVESLRPMLYLIGSFYLTCFLFVVLVLGSIAKCSGFNIFRFLRYILDEIFLVLGSSSSESALLPLMDQLERAGCSRSVVSLVVPTGFSFNLDGTNIYITLSCLFIAQALGIELSLGKQISILLIAMLSSKGASGVTGAGFITLAATLSIVPEVPIAGLALILGIDRFMSEARAITNMIGNGVATLVISKWEGELDFEKLKSTHIV